MIDEYELIIMGGGAAGFAAAMKADGLKAKRLMINNNTVGGTCVNARVARRQDNEGHEHHQNLLDGAAKREKENDDAEDESHGNEDVN